jgi:hypothetical protein
MTVNITRIRTHIQNFRFEDLFIDELGWDQQRNQFEVVVDGNRVTLNAFAEKRGMVALHIADIPEYKLRRKIEQQVAKAHRENIIIYSNTQNNQQVWQWVRRETGKPLANRERQYYKGQSGENIAQILAGIAFSLDEEDDLTIVDVTSRVRAAFDMERVTRRFYDRFKRQHDAFLEFINGIPDEDFQRWYASVMLNRLMFIYFVQKKGFLDGDVDYLRNRLSQIDGNFYRDFLCPLFFEGFAKKEHPAVIRRLLGDVPYLNGGLFLQHQIEEVYGDAIQIENEAFEKLFDFFDEYHWHLDERPLRNDNEINPDVLGYIFEKYINQKQMGAYYTKEDITEYISKNTVIPFLFDEARKAVKIAFEGDHTLWDLLTENPDRYIYPAARHGAEYELPENIAVGLDDVSQRRDWNTPAPSEYALPTEIWREVVARRTRYAEMRGKLERGEVGQINDLITLNLDIQQFAQDVIDYTDSADVVRAFWKAINRVTVLDPTCGSGAFLFAALNILEPLYEACLERMEGFVAELERTGGGHPQKYSDFREVLARIDQHPNRRYFVLKSIIVNNLFGVDIMEEAVEICKLRLFLKLVAQVGDKGKIEPLPDIDFNIRAGNTLVGFATQDEVKRAMTTTSGGQGKLLFGEDQAALEEIERKAADVDRLFGLFRQQQTALGGEVRPEDKQALREKLRVLEDELNRLLAGQYGIDPTKTEQYAKWRKSHEPFHWFVEFYGVLKNGGFDVIIGNPPYVEYRLVRNDYTLRDDYYKSLESNNLYAYCMERSTQLIALNGWFGMIVPTSVIGLDRTNFLREVLLERFELHLCSTYGIRPSKIFDGVDQRLCIYVGKSGKQKPVTIQTTRHHYWYSEERPNLFASLKYNRAFNHGRLLRFPQIPNIYGLQILEKLEAQSHQTIQQYFANTSNGYLMHYHRSPRYWIRGIDFEPHFRSATSTRSVHHFRDLHFRNPTEGKVIGALLNSSLFYFWFISMGNGRNITGTDIEEFPIGTLAGEILEKVPPIFDGLMDDYRNNSIIRVRANQEYQEFYQSKSKPIMDEIDRVLARHYGFSDQELDFIINYDIKYRMGDNLGGDDDEAEE